MFLQNTINISFLKQKTHSEQTFLTHYQAAGQSDSYTVQVYI